MKAARAPGTHSFLAKRIGRLPTYSPICLNGIGRGDTRRHDEAAWRAYLAEGEQQFRVRLFQDPAEGAVVDGDELVLDCLEHLAHRSEEHTSELQSLAYLVCRLLLEKKKSKKT